MSGTQTAPAHRREGFLARASGPLLIFAIVAGMFWKLVFTRQYTWLDSPQIAGAVLPWFQLQAASLHRWSLTLWDPYQWCGHPLAAEGESGSLYPLNWLLWAMPLHRTWLRHVYLNWYFVLIHFQAALFAYWLCRDQQRSRPASILGGIAFAFGPFLGTNSWPAALNAAVWAPLQLMFFLRARRGAPRQAKKLDRPLFSAAASGAALGASWLSGSREIATVLSLALAALWIWRALRTRSWRQAAIAGAGALGIGAMQILPSIEYLAHAPAIAVERAGVAWQSNAIAPMNLVNLVLPGAGDSALFIGWIILALAAIGVWRYSSQPATRICLVLGAAGLMIAVGPYSMFSGVLYGARLAWKDPHSGLCLLALALPIPVAAGLDAIREGVRRPPLVSWVLLGAAGLSALALLVLSMVAGDHLQRLTPVALSALNAFAAFALIESRSRSAISANAAAVLAILLAMWQFGHVSGADWRNIEFGWPSLRTLAGSADLAAAARTLPPGSRLADPGGSAGFELGDWLGIDQFDGISGGTRNIASVADLPTPRALGGSTFVIGGKAAGELVFESVSGIKAYAAPNSFPPAWVATHVTGFVSSAEARKRLRQPASHFMGAAFVEGAPPASGGCANGGDAAQIARTARSIRVRARLRCPGLVAIGQTYYPGWIALVDGKPAKLYETDGFLDGVAANPGEHVIDLVYRPWTIWGGAAISAASALLLAVGYRRSR